MKRKKTLKKLLIQFKKTTNLNYKTNSKPYQQNKKIINDLNKLNNVNTNAKLVLLIYCF